MTASAEPEESSPTPYIFISYRRDDTLAASRRIMQFFHRQYGSLHVFMDIAEIRDSNLWPEEIEHALKCATVLIAVIGRDWLTLQAERGGRRIDQPDDWVRKEIAFAIKKGILVIPIFIGTTPFRREALPDSLRQLTDFAGRIIGQDNEFENQVIQLGDSLQRHGFPALNKQIELPKAKISLKPFSPVEIRGLLKTLNGWRISTTPLRDKEHVICNELYKQFEFKSFRRAMEFMYLASFEMNRVDHHPRWQNTWHTVEVWLSTWDVQFDISTLDAGMANYLDRLEKHVRGLPTLPKEPAGDQPRYNANSAV